MRVYWALSLVHTGELFAARQALEEGLVAPGTHATVRVTNFERRSAVPRERLSPFQMDTDLFLVTLRKSRRGVAPGPSGMQSDHHFSLMERPSLAQVASAMAVGDVLEDVLEVIRLGRVSSDTLRRLVVDDREASVEEGSHRTFPTGTIHQSRMRVYSSHFADPYRY